MLDEKYIKIVYESEPIGKEKIILYLTTFDIDKYNYELNKKNIAINVPIDKSEIVNISSINSIENRLNEYIKNFYEPYINEAKQLIDTKKIMSKSIDLNLKSICNSGDIHCNVVYGNITNCDNVYCNEIKGNVVNCDKIIYKNKGVIYVRKKKSR